MIGFCKSLVQFSLSLNSPIDRRFMKVVNSGPFILRSGCLLLLEGAAITTSGGGEGFRPWVVGHQPSRLKLLRRGKVEGHLHYLSGLRGGHSGQRSEGAGWGRLFRVYLY